MGICGLRVALAAIAVMAIAGCGAEASPDAVTSNLPPIISGTPPTSLNAGSAYMFAPQAADPDGDPLTFSALNLPGWAHIDTQTGVVTGVPTEADVGMTGMITIEVSDSKAIADLPAFRIQVSSSVVVPPPANTAPTIAGVPAISATVGVIYTFSPVGNDADNDTLTYTIQNRPSWATFTPATGQLTGTPATGNIGTTSNIVISVSDGTDSASLPAFNLQVVAAPVTPPANRPPTISGVPATSVTAGTAYSFRPVASDPDGNTLTWSIQGLPAWATFSATTGRLSGTPTAANVGTSARITITVSDATLSASLPSFTIQVIAQANRAPVITGTPTTSLNVGSTYSFQPSASDADGNALTFSIQNRPAWATFSTSTGLLTGTPTSADVGTFANVTISVSDGTAIVSLPAFTITVAQVSTGSATVSWTAPTTNTDGSALTNLAGYRVAYGRAQDTLNQSASLTNASLSTYVVSNLASGTWYFAVYAVNSGGVESGVSNIASKAIP